MTTRQRFLKIFRLALLVTASLLLIAADGQILMALKISGPQAPDGGVFDYAINATSQSTVFMSDPITDHIMELYSVPTWGGERVLLSPGMTAMRGVLDFVLSPDGMTAVYWVGFSEAEHHAEAFYAVPVSGGTPIDLTGKIEPGLDLEQIAISADNGWLFYTLGNNTENKHFLYRVPLDGSAEPSAISPTETTCLELKFEPMPSGHGVVYARTKLALAGSDLVYVNSSGVSLTLVTISGVFAGGKISPNGLWVLYIEDLYGTSGNDLYAVSLDGLTRNRLNSPLGMNGDVINIQVSNDSRYVVYKADQDIDEQFEIYAVKLADLATADLILTIVPGGDVLDYQIVNWLGVAVGVVYRADQLVDEKIDLGGVLINGTSPVHLSPGLSDNGDVTSFQVMANGLGVVFVADYYDEVFSLWLNEITGGEPHPVGTVVEGADTADWPLTADVVRFQIAPNSSYVIFMANLDQQYVTEAYIAASSGSGWTRRQKINAPLVADGNVESFQITPNSQGVVYYADQDTNDMYELYSVFNRYPQYLPVVSR